MASTAVACLPTSCLRSGEGEIHRLGSCLCRDLVEKTRFEIRNLKTGKIGGVRGFLWQPDDLIGPTGDKGGIDLTDSQMKRNETRNRTEADFASFGMYSLPYDRNLMSPLNGPLMDL